MTLVGSVKLEYNLKKGEILRYKSAVETIQEMTQQGKTQKDSSIVEMQLAQWVTDVSKDGIYSIEILTEKAEVTMAGEKKELPQTGQKTTIKMGKNGEMKQAAGGAPVGQAPFPNKLLSVGDSWVQESSLPIPIMNEEGTVTGSKAAKLTYTYTVKGFEKLLGHDCAQIAIKCPPTSIDIQPGVLQRISAEGSSYFGITKGRLVKSTLATTIEIEAGGETMKTVNKISMELLRTEPPALGSQDEAFIVG